MFTIIDSLDLLQSLKSWSRSLLVRYFRESKCYVKYVNTAKSMTWEVPVFKSNRMFGIKHSTANWLCAKQMNRAQNIGIKIFLIYIYIYIYIYINVNESKDIYKWNRNLKSSWIYHKNIVKLRRRLKRDCVNSTRFRILQWLRYKNEK